MLNQISTGKTKIPVIYFKFIPMLSNLDKNILKNVQRSIYYSKPSIPKFLNYLMSQTEVNSLLTDWLFDIWPKSGLKTAVGGGGNLAINKKFKKISKIIFHLVVFRFYPHDWPKQPHPHPHPPPKKHIHINANTKPLQRPKPPITIQNWNQTVYIRFFFMRWRF